MNHGAHPLVSAEISIFHRKSANFAISKKTDIDCIIHNLIQNFNTVLINMTKILMMSANIATPDFPKIKFFEIKVITS